MRCTSLFLCWLLGWGTILANFHMCGVFVSVKSSFNMLVRNASPNKADVF